MYIRLSKIILVLSIGLYSLLVTFGNIVDYNSNFQFVQHVFSMDTTFPDNNLMWRAIANPFVHHVAYIFIIITEALIAFFCLKGGFNLFKKLKGTSEEFNLSKKNSIIGLTAAFVLWFVGFIIIGGEWFLMWQSETWNGIEAAFRISVVVLLVFLFISRND